VTSAAQNVEIVDRAYRSWRERGLEGLVSVMHPEIEWHTPPQAPEPGPHRGREEILRVVGSYLDSFEQFLPIPDRILPAAETDQVVVLATLTTRGRGSGAEVVMPVGHLLTIRDGKVARMQVFTEQRDALAAAGLDPSG
jgi:ketosteroid isomerase-like protein